MEKIYAVYNGSFSNLEEIKISPLSRAYTFSDSVYEVIPFYNFLPIAFKQHISRLQNSCNALSISINIDIISSEITSLIKKSNLENGYVYYQISRGIDTLRSHMYEDSLDEETFGYAVEHNFNSQKLRVSLCEDVRWQRCDIKSTSLLGNVLSMNQAKKDGCNEVIMHKSNFITEGGASNIFFATDDCIFTPSLANNILPGITRELLIEEIRKIGLKFEEGDYSVDELSNAKSIWLTSSTKGLAQVKEVVNLKTNLIENHRLFLECEKIFNNKYLS
jgi:D-alanine transaminase